MFILINKNLCIYQEKYQIVDNYYLYYNKDSYIKKTKDHIVLLRGYVYKRINVDDLFHEDFKKSTYILSADDILQLYLEYQEDFLTKIDGAFCGVIISIKADKITEIFAFTDAISKKTLYFYHDKYLGITSEISLFKTATNTSEINEEFIIHQVLLGSSFNKLTQVNGLMKLYGGTYLKYTNELKMHRYFYIKKELRQLSKLGSDLIINNQRNLIINTLKKYYDQNYNTIMCDVSGGIDSSIVAGILNNIRNTSNYKSKIYGYHLGIPRGIGTEVGFAKEVSKMNDLDLIVEERNIDDFTIANFTKEPRIIRESILFTDSINKTNDFKLQNNIVLSFSGQGGDFTLNESYRLYKRCGLLKKHYKRDYFQEALYSHKNYWKYLARERKWKQKKNFYQYIKNFFMLEYPTWLKASEDEFTKQYNKQYLHLGCFKNCDLLFLDYYIDLDSFSDIQHNSIKRFPLLDIDLIINSIYLDLYNFKKSSEYRGYYKNIFRDLLPEMILKRKGKSRVDAKVLEKLTVNKEIIIENIKNFSKVYLFSDEEALRNHFSNILSGSANLSIFLRLMSIFKAYE